MKLFNLFRRRNTRKPAAPAVERRYVVVYEPAIGRDSLDWEIGAISKEIALKAFRQSGEIYSRIVCVIPA